MAGVFSGNVQITGNVSKAGGSFRIDDPIDPAGKYLSHSFVESPDMKNVYDGVVTTDGGGYATVTMPAWFGALNRDFRYQLTVIGPFAQAAISSEMADNRFTIHTDRAGVKVSWQVTGIRQDAWANAHRIPVEEEKTGSEQGHFLHPELFGKPNEESIVDASLNTHLAPRVPRSPVPAAASSTKEQK
jgi:trimeric autotransporter adhesin